MALRYKLFLFFLFFTGFFFIFSDRAVAANPYIQNVIFSQDELGDYIEFDWVDAPGQIDDGYYGCQRNLVAIWLDRFNPNGVIEGMTIMPDSNSVSLVGDFMSGNAGSSYSGFGNSGFASGRPTSNCSSFFGPQEPVLSEYLPRHLKTYFNPAWLPQQLSFSAEDFITIQLLGLQYNTGLIKIFAHDPEQYFYQPSTNPFPALPFENLQFGFNENSELTVSFDWVHPDRNGLLLVGMNGSINYSNGSSFEPDLSKNDSFIFEGGGNNNLNQPNWLNYWPSGGSQFNRGEHYELSVRQLHRWTPARDFTSCSIHYPCPLQQYQVEAFMGREFLPDDYITISFTSSEPYQYTFNNETKYYFQPQQGIDPVIVIPGILGSWPVPELSWQIDPVSLQPFLTSAGVPGSLHLKLSDLRVDPILGVYDNLFVALQRAGYIAGETLFAFPYEWRQSNVITAQKLEEMIAEVKDICRCGRVDLVAHSMGGLVARSYIQGPDYQDDVDQLVFLGTPHLGSPKSYLQWEALEGFDSDLEKVLAKAVFKLEALKHGYLNTLNYIRDGILSLEQLLPIYDYLKESSTGELRSYPTDYPINSFLEILNNDVALNLLKNRVEIINIEGDAGDQSTLNFIRVEPDPDSEDDKWIHGIPENFENNLSQGLENGPGDGTVPRSSQDLPGANSFVISSGHSELPTNAQQDVIEKLIGIRPTEFIDLSFVRKLLFINIKSPADFYILAPDGKRLGKDFLTDNTFNEIPFGYYTGFDTDIEFVTIPNPLDGDYKIFLQGTDEGEYELEVNLIDDDSIVTGIEGGYIVEDLEETLNVVLDFSLREVIEVKPEDQTPPSIVISSPQEDKVYTRQDSLTINYLVTDDTGVQDVEATLGSEPRGVLNGEVVDLFFEDIGTHTLTITAKDYLSNETTLTMSFEVGVTYDSFTKDIKRAYGLGWIKNKTIYNTLLTQAGNVKKAKNNLARRIQLQTITSLVSTFYNLGFITKEGYNLLNGDVGYLIGKL